MFMKYCGLTLFNVNKNLNQIFPSGYDHLVIETGLKGEIKWFWRVVKLGFIILNWTPMIYLVQQFIVDVLKKYHTVDMSMSITNHFQYSFHKNKKWGWEARKIKFSQRSQDLWRLLQRFLRMKIYWVGINLGYLDTIDPFLKNMHDGKKIGSRC